MLPWWASAPNPEIAMSENDNATPAPPLPDSDMAREIEWLRSLPKGKKWEDIDRSSPEWNCEPPELDWAKDSADAVISYCDAWKSLLCECPSKIGELIEVSARVAFHAEQRGIDPSNLLRFGERLESISHASAPNMHDEFLAACKNRVAEAGLVVKRLNSRALAEIARGLGHLQTQQIDSSKPPVAPITEAVIALGPVSAGDRPKATLARFIEVDLERGTVSLRGHSVAVTPHQARIFKRLLDAKGGWVSGNDLKQYRDSSERPDRIIKKLPKEVRSLIDSRRGTGYCLRTLVE
jgi:hypothetical protein